MGNYEYYKKCRDELADTKAALAEAWAAVDAFAAYQFTTPAAWGERLAQALPGVAWRPGKKNPNQAIVYLPDGGRETLIGFVRPDGEWKIYGVGGNSACWHTHTWRPEALPSPEALAAAAWAAQGRSIEALAPKFPEGAKPPEGVALFRALWEAEGAYKAAAERENAAAY